MLYAFPRQCIHLHSYVYILFCLPDLFCFEIPRHHSSMHCRHVELENRNLMERVVHASCQSELEAQGLLFTLENIPEIRRVYLTTTTTILSENLNKFIILQK